METAQNVTDSQALNLIYKTIYYDESFDGGYDKGRNLNRVDPGPDSRLALSELAYPMVDPLWEKDTA